jgi:hypothetical protein
MWVGHRYQHFRINTFTVIVMVEDLAVRLCFFTKLRSVASQGTADLCFF